MLDVPLFIGGQAIAAAQRDALPLVHPATGVALGAAAIATRDDVDAAVGAARTALAGPWGTMSPNARADLLCRVADGIDARRDAFVRAEVADTGKPIAFARAVDVPRGAANLRFFANLIRGTGDSAYEQHTAAGTALHYTLRRPVGVVAVVCPWNLPLLLMTWKVGPALACGNAVVVKPSEETPQTATLLAEVMRDAGVPDGVYNVVHGRGPGCAGEHLTTHAGVDAITFTGESATGTAIMRAAAPGVRPVSFELGGKNAAIVFDDADLDRAVSGVARSTFSNCGQVCLCSERVLVHRSIYEPFVERLAARAAELRAGDPFDDATQMGSLISAEHHAKVQAAIAGAVRDGAEVRAGGGPPRLDAPFHEGAFFAPTVLTGLADDASAVRDEIFGPVCHVAPFDDEDEAVARANDSEYGLCAAIWTEGLRRAHRVAGQLDVGIVWANTWFLRDLRTPFGGVKLSGIGREGGLHSLDFYSELRNVCIQL